MRLIHGHLSLAGRGRPRRGRVTGSTPRVQRRSPSPGAPSVACVERRFGISKTAPSRRIVVRQRLGLHRQGHGNLTGFINFEASLGSKWLELLHEIAPRVSRVAFMFNPNTAPYARYYLATFRSAASALAVEPI